MQQVRTLRDPASLAGSRRRQAAIIATLLVVVVAGAAVSVGLPPPRPPSAATVGMTSGASLPAASTTIGRAQTSPAEPASSEPIEPAPPAKPSASSIVPGSVNRTSINLVATYDVSADLGFNARSLRVDAAITVTNRSGAGIDRVELNTIAGVIGNLRFGRVQVDGADVQPRLTGQTIVVPLGGVLPDDATAVLRVRFRATLRSTLGGSSWMFTRTGGILQANRWLPWVGLHRPFKRPNHGDPFFSALSPHVRVRITTDRKLVIVAPGRRVSIDGLTETFVAENVRDFHIVASPYYTVRERRVGAWTLKAFVRPGFPTTTVLNQAADGLRKMSALAGTYPYPTFKIAQTAGGFALEGPGMIWIPTGLNGGHLRWNVYHETAHQWFYGLVGSDGALEPFADEAVATYFGQYVSDPWRTTGCPKRRLDLSIYEYNEACYFGQIYVHGANTLREVRRTMGYTAFWRAIRAYVAEHRFGIGSTRALLETFDAHTTKNLEPIFSRWFPSIY